jgi:hypothetical protein
MRAWTITLFMLAVSFNCAAQEPVFSTNATSFDFGGIAVGGLACCPSGPDRNIIVTNTGTALLTVSDFQITGDFFIPQVLVPIIPHAFQLNPGESRIITLEFSAAAAGPRTGSITFTDNAPGNPHRVALTGNGLTDDFSLTVAETPASATVNAGEGANFTLDLASGGQFPQSQITLSCSGLPPGGGCNLPPQFGQFGLTPQQLLFIGVNISTRATAVSQNRTKLPLWYGFALIVPVGLISIRRRKSALSAMVVSVIVVSALVSCGGSNIRDQATPPGTYHIAFSATSGTTTHTAPATLIVR